mmetsp:Transcript_19746/g.17457  ORF Transcript_19746/g.17457 Transcript_19746/m.17457 type:complete len:225 (+) Transcript_19746:449-1123(+)
MIQDKSSRKMSKSQLSGILAVPSNKSRRNSNILDLNRSTESIFSGNNLIVNNESEPSISSVNDIKEVDGSQDSIINKITLKLKIKKVICKKQRTNNRWDKFLKRVGDNSKKKASFDETPVPKELSKTVEVSLNENLPPLRVRTRHENPYNFEKSHNGFKYQKYRKFIKSIPFTDLYINKIRISKLNEKERIDTDKKEIIRKEISASKLDPIKLRKIFPRVHLAQ